MNGPRCGRCRGRGYIRPLNPADDPTCPDCEGSGDKPRYKSKPKVQPQYESQATVCVYERHGDCSGRMTWDHVIRRNTITNHVLGGRGLTVELANELRQILSDPRLLVGSCLGHNLVRESSGEPQPRPEDLHPEFFAAVKEYGLEPCLPRWITAQSEAA